MPSWTRRKVLKGMMAGSAVTIGLPLLDCFLDTNGVAFASGAPLPVRFGTWFWGCGVNAARFFPTKVGRDWEMTQELRPLEPYRDKLTVFSGFNTLLGSRQNLVHWSGVMGTFSGAAPSRGGQAGGATDYPTIDTLVADAIGGQSRFKSLEVACTGNTGVSYSMRAGSTVNPSEVDPVALYKRIFGPEFQDPNAATFTPNPAIMVRQSVLSSVNDERADLMKAVGAADRARLDEYFTSLRQMENQLASMLEKPAPMESCTIPKATAQALKLGPVWDQALQTHEVLSKLVVLALACNQTKVFNIALSTAASNLRKAGSTVSLHELTHQEVRDPKLGYQPEATFLLEKAMEGLATMVKTLDSVKEGDGTLLDRTLMLAASEANYAKNHTLESMPVLVAGRGGGKWKSGLHITGKGDPTSRVGLTIQQTLGMPVGEWGAEAMLTSRPISEVI